ncbi:hypothetical protein VOLCADRAFT_97132 [Volvox carteri f. nagariensis]|uniref:Uncharacterized protein n=1 Tax=Volvox carteri f. nagariensis TaxID=3068 RepID=D8UBY9_VOLCA|nr:uncharacterized protein VOLCADRAFT_97132 [Volvox carteri f. nagariensis]EFJ42704.1 hypothetical protein VOLCADRAFT_97132 [Volvox carteri f. nagariensis]|eukprot:XP_002956165.1 hypothetical protein VOLCADRAFT_97132 [Volvox carteri f. nagariensis]
MGALHLKPKGNKSWQEAVRRETLTKPLTGEVLVGVANALRLKAYEFRLLDFVRTRQGVTGIDGNPSGPMGVLPQPLLPPSQLRPQLQTGPALQHLHQLIQQQQAMLTQNQQPGPQAEPSFTKLQQTDTVLHGSQGPIGTGPMAMLLAGSPPQQQHMLPQQRPINLQPGTLGGGALQQVDATAVSAGAPLVATLAPLAPTPVIGAMPLRGAGPVVLPPMVDATAVSAAFDPATCEDPLIWRRHYLLLVKENADQKLQLARMVAQVADTDARAAALSMRLQAATCEQQGLVKSLAQLSSSTTAVLRRARKWTLARDVDADADSVSVPNPVSDLVLERVSGPSLLRPGSQSQVFRIRNQSNRSLLYFPLDAFTLADTVTDTTDKTAKQLKSANSNAVGKLQQHAELGSGVKILSKVCTEALERQACAAFVGADGGEGGAANGGYFRGTQNMSFVTLDGMAHLVSRNCKVVAGRGVDWVHEAIAWIGSNPALEKGDWTHSPWQRVVPSVQGAAVLYGGGDGEVGDV